LVNYFESTVYFQRQSDGV